MSDTLSRLPKSGALGTRQDFRVSLVGLDGNGKDLVPRAVPVSMRIAKVAAVCTAYHSRTLHIYVRQSITFCGASILSTFLDGCKVNELLDEEEKSQIDGYDTIFEKYSLYCNGRWLGAQVRTAKNVS